MYNIYENRQLEMGLSVLHKYICVNAEAARYPGFATVTKSYIQNLLQTSDIIPFKIKYYLEKEFLILLHF